MTRRSFLEPVVLPDDEAEEVAPRALDEGQLSSLRGALSGLTSKQREAVELHFFEGMTQGQIARKLGITQQVVQKRLHGVIRRGKRIGGALPRLKSALMQRGDP